MNFPEKQTSRPAGKFDRGVMMILVVFLVIAAVVGAAAFAFSRDFFSHTTLIAVDNTLPLPPDATVVSGTAVPGSTAPHAPMPTTPVNISPEDARPKVWDGTSRVTLLLMGMDYRDWESGVDIPRTDTMILFSIDPLTKTAGMLSIPRDMWVTIPGFTNGRINTAYPLGEGSKLPGGGPGLAMKTVENFIGVPVDYYALVDFNSFVRFIDELGGLDMHIREEITVDPIGQGNTRKLEPGVQTLDGATTLAYARMRYTQDGDFDRSKRQQEVIMAMRDQIVNFNQLPMLVAKAPKLYEELASGIRTNLSLDQVIQLAWLATQIDVNNIQRGVFDPHKDVGYATVTASGIQQQVLVPVPDQIRVLRDKVFVSGQPTGPAAQAGDLSELMRQEGARVLVKNGTQAPGMAAQASEIFRAAGMNVTGEMNADNVYGSTTIIDHTGKPYTIKYVIEALKVQDFRIISQFDPAAASDVEVIIGTDWPGQ